MIARNVIMHDYAWVITLFLDCDTDDAEKLEELLSDYDLTEEFVEKVGCGYKNIHLVRYNYEQGESVIAVSKTTDEDELLAILQRCLVNTAIDMATLLGMPVSDMVPDVVARVSVHTSPIVMPLLNPE